MRKHLLRLTAIATLTAGYFCAALFIAQPDGSWHWHDALLLVALMACVFSGGVLWLQSND